MYWFLYKEKQNLKNSQPQPKCQMYWFLYKEKQKRTANLNPKYWFLYKEKQNLKKPTSTQMYWFLYKEKQNLKNSQPQPKCTGSYIKKNKILRTANLNPNVLVLI